MTWIILWATDHVVGLQVSPEEEAAGLDLSEHAEAGYEWPAASVDLTLAPGGSSNSEAGGDDGSQLLA